ncbi:hypothetical protein DAEQUDRAFT_541959 [Daedalea quercina L-15889]|uniref:Uncharacterized protein n=1 Tax=Daedalea quercina L-15889 TaxID=1314783 RepID=A0A165M473_9APHY|nr:hypothetical protein DAEQUDRAFT_541959 [Daedalea quercina L-15889]
MKRLWPCISGTCPGAWAHLRELWLSRYGASLPPGMRPGLRDIAVPRCVQAYKVVRGRRELRDTFPGTSRFTSPGQHLHIKEPFQPSESVLSNAVRCGAALPSLVLHDHERSDEPQRTTMTTSDRRELKRLEGT